MQSLCLLVVIASIIKINGLTASRRLIELLESEEMLINSLIKHIEQEEGRIQSLENRLESLSEVVSGRSPRDDYVTNPLGILTLIRRFTADWLTILNTVSDPSVGLKWPTREDVEASARSLIRLQLTYNLTTNHLAGGILADTPTSIIFTGRDCYCLALTCYENQEHSLAAQWLEQALIKRDDTVPQAILLELYYLSTCFSGNTNLSQTLLTNLLENFSNYSLSAKLLEDWKLAASKGCEKALWVMKEKYYQNIIEKTVPPRDKVIYSQMCKENLISHPDLKCRYVHYHKRHLRLAPFRLEELHLDPPLVMFHDLISDREIEEAKRLSKFEPSRTINSMGVGKVSYHRNSEVAWFFEENSIIIEKLEQRMVDATSLDISLAEPNQVSRYGPGGEFVFHMDYTRFYETNMVERNRLATLMFYLNDVKQGGYTIFEDWNISVKPKKGSALLWFNVNRDGTQDRRTTHAGCPVLTGSKWVLNKWFHEGKNEFLLPCLPNNENSFRHFYV